MKTMGKRGISQMRRDLRYDLLHGHVTFPGRTNLALHHLHSGPDLARAFGVSVLPGLQDYSPFDPIDNIDRSRPASPASVLDDEVENMMEEEAKIAASKDPKTAAFIVMSPFEDESPGSHSAGALLRSGTTTGTFDHATPQSEREHLNVKDLASFDGHDRKVWLQSMEAKWQVLRNYVASVTQLRDIRHRGSE